MDYISKILAAILNLFNLKNIIYILLIIIGGLIIIRLGDKTLSKIEQKFDLNLTAHYLFKDIWKYTVIIVAIAWILHVLGINLESIIISLGVVGIVIGLASQDIVSNFISGIFVISDKKIEIGEVIDIVKKNGGPKACTDEKLRKDLIEEMADVLMFYNDVMLCYGISEDELKQIYVEKFEKNMKRW